MGSTIFSRIIAGEIPSKKAYEDGRVFAFHDVNPQAPVHVLIVPKVEIATVDDIKPADESLIGHMVWVAAEIARREGIAEDGYRLVFNCRGHGGQTVEHLHLHLLGKRQMDWPPG